MNFSDCKLDDLKRFVGVRFIGFGASNDVIPKIWIKKWGKKRKKKYVWLQDCSSEKAKSCAEVQEWWKAYTFEPLYHSCKYQF